MDFKVFSVVSVAWYDNELTQYQRERQDTELERIFDERHKDIQEGNRSLAAVHIQSKTYKEPDTEWQQQVKLKKGEEYFNKLQELESEQVTKELRLREQSHQFAVPGEKIVHSSLAKGMAEKYQESL